MERIKQLEDFLKEDPDDPFNIYALALEYLKTERAKARELFEKLLHEQPDYLPTYYPLAHLLIDLNETEKAEEVFKTGIKRAETAKDSKAHRELQAAYNDWLFERE